MKMREIQASEAKTKLPELLRDVERGETLIITRHGKPIARLVPDLEQQQARARAAVAAIREMRKGNGTITVEEILSARDEGRRF